MKFEIKQIDLNKVGVYMTIKKEYDTIEQVLNEAFEENLYAPKKV